MSHSFNSQVSDDLSKLLAVLPRTIRHQVLALPQDLSSLIEVVCDLGRQPEARFPDKVHFLGPAVITREDIDHVTSRLGTFGLDNRAGIEATLHRISAIRNRAGAIIGLTCRVGRAVFGTVDVIKDVVKTRKSILLLGRPGVGKTTLLREIARVLADEEMLRVVVVDTSNEIAGDGDIPHPGIGLARRMQVPRSDQQHAVMIEAVENHMPQVIVVDEIGTEAEAYAARTIAERGVTLVATAHGNTLENLILNPTLSDLIGGIQSVTLSDEEARRRRTQKSVLERRSPPTFDVLIEIKDKDTFAIQDDLATVIDLMLRDEKPEPEIRMREGDKIQVVQTANIASLARDYGLNRSSESRPGANQLAPAPPGTRVLEGAKIFPYAVSRNRLESAIKTLAVPAFIVRSWEEADFVLTVKGQVRKGGSKFELMQRRNLPIHSIRSNTLAQIQQFLKSYYGIEDLTPEELALRETEEAIKKVTDTGRPIDLAPQIPFIRSLQHDAVGHRGLSSKNMGSEPYCYVRVFRTA